MNLRAVVEDKHFAFDEFQTCIHVALCFGYILLHKYRANLFVYGVLGREV